MAMNDKFVKGLQRELFFLVTILIASNAYFVQRVIATVDNTTQEIIYLREHIAKIENEIENLKDTEPAKWRRF